VAEIILHQYATSPFSEKIRKIFAHKKITWRSVEQPVIMPKPKLVPLTGGYRRIPVLQNRRRRVVRHGSHHSENR
jgi:glutathione S-transferase